MDQLKAAVQICVGRALPKFLRVVCTADLERIELAQSAIRFRTQFESATTVDVARGKRSQTAIEWGLIRIVWMRDQPESELKSPSACRCER